jgi:2-polyprenyl-3-methyl-5-hydroxy-6-metoxy-1,4-benzoquinol methylase
MTVPSENSPRIEDYSHLSPTGRRLVADFRRRVVGLAVAEAPSSVLEVGCGQGWLLRDLAGALPGALVAGIDVREDAVSHARRLLPSAEVLVATAEHLPFGDHEFDLVVCSEVLEHVRDPREVLAEIDRVGRGVSVLSVPDEPWFWLANLARGKHLRTLGNFPGHIHHWSRAGFVRLLSRGGGAVTVTRSFPWLVARVERQDADATSVAGRPHA